MSLGHRGLNGVTIALWHALCNIGQVLMRTSHCLLRSERHRAMIVSTKMRAYKHFSDASLERLHSLSVSCVMSPIDAADLESPLSVSMQVSAPQPSWIAMIISCWSVKLLKLRSVTVANICDINSYNSQGKGQPGIRVVKIFCDSDSSGSKSFRLRLLDSTALLYLTSLKLINFTVLAVHC